MKFLDRAFDRVISELRAAEADPQKDSPFATLCATAALIALFLGTAIIAIGELQ